MATDDYDSVRISKEIENTNIETSLKPFSEEERDQEVERVRNEFTSIAQGLENEQGTQPFNMAQFKEQRADLELATSLNSYPDLYHAIMNAGKIFEKANSPVLNRSEKTFHCEIKKTRDIENLFKVMVEGLKTLTVGPEVLLLNSEDLVIAFAGCIKACLESVNAYAEEKIYKAFPIVKQGSIAWIQYDFHSIKTSRTVLFRTTHLVDIHVVQKYFYFPTEYNFRNNLFQAERSIKKRKNQDR